jgi:hypothetical protein
MSAPFSSLPVPVLTKVVTTGWLNYLSFSFSFFCLGLSVFSFSASTVQIPPPPALPYLWCFHPDCRFSLGWELGANWLNEILELRTWLGMKNYQCWFLGSMHASCFARHTAVIVTLPISVFRCLSSLPCWFVVPLLCLVAFLLHISISLFLCWSWSLWVKSSILLSSLFFIFKFFFGNSFNVLF